MARNLKTVPVSYRRRGKAEFTPKSIPGLVVWLDAGRITGVADGANVTTWEDLSGQGNDVTQSTAAKRPSLQVDILNGKPVVRFDGSDDYLLNTSFPDFPDEATGFVVATLATGDAAQALWDISSGEATNNGILLFHDTVLKASVVGDNGQKTRTGGDQRGAFHIFTLPYNGPVGLFVDGDDKGTTTSAGALANTLDRLTVGQLGSIAVGWYLDGDIAELVVYNRAVSAAERNQMERYLSNKYAIALS